MDFAYGEAPFGAAPTPPPASSGITLALTGNAATGAVGSVAPGISLALSGVHATGAVGAVSTSQSLTRALTGVHATGAVGSIVASKSGSVALTGVRATGAVGRVLAAGGKPVEGVTQNGPTIRISPVERIIRVSVDERMATIPVEGGQFVRT